MHRTFREVGKCLADRWGFDDDGNFEAALKKMPAHSRIYCLLAAVVGELRGVRHQLENDACLLQSERSSPGEAHPIADGMLRAIHGDLKYGVRIPDKLTDMDLSVRAHKTLVRAGIKYVSEITRERLMNTHGCGVTTACELMKWAESLAKRAMSDG